MAGSAGHLGNVGQEGRDSRWLQPNSHENGTGKFQINQIGVRADSRGQGIGTALMAYIEERAEDLGARAIGLDHWAFNTPAREFFAARGFKPQQVKMRKDVES